jgi:hypothetical protein
MAQSEDNQIVISRIENNIIWMQFIHKGKPIYEVPLAQSIRDFLEKEHQIDLARGDGFNTEVAFKKLNISEVLESELLRA